MLRDGERAYCLDLQYISYGRRRTAQRNSFLRPYCNLNGFHDVSSGPSLLSLSIYRTFTGTGTIQVYGVLIACSTLTPKG